MNKGVNDELDEIRKRYENIKTILASIACNIGQTVSQDRADMITVMYFLSQVT